MASWIESQRKKIEEGKQAEEELSRRVAKFLTATARGEIGDAVYSGLKMSSVRYIEQGGEEFVVGQILISRRLSGISTTGFQINVDALNNIDETLRQISEFNRLTGR